MYIKFSYEKYSFQQDQVGHNEPVLPARTRASSSKHAQSAAVKQDDLHLDLRESISAGRATRTPKNISEF